MATSVTDAAKSTMEPTPDPEQATGTTNEQLYGQSHSKSDAVVEAEKAIDRALSPKKVRLVPLPGRWD